MTTSAPQPHPKYTHPVGIELLLLLMLIFGIGAVVTFELVNFINYYVKFIGV